MATQGGSCDGKSMRFGWTVCVLSGLLAVACFGVSAKSVNRVSDGLPVRPANAETVFDHVLVFPAAADDQAIESWRQRAIGRIEAECIEPAGCVVRSVRFHVAARWQLPMVGILVEGRTRSRPASHLADEPVWLANTSVQSVREQIAALVGN